MKSIGVNWDKKPNRTPHIDSGHHAVPVDPALEERKRKHEAERATLARRQRHAPLNDVQEAEEATPLNT